MNRAQQQGFGLIEALVAVLIMSIGLLGLATLQTQGLRNNTSAYFRTQASILTSSMLDVMRSDVESARSSEYNLTMAMNPEVDGSSNLVEQKIRWWLDDIARVLPDGDGAIRCSDTACAVAIRWKDSLLEGSALQGLTDYDGDDVFDNDVDDDGVVDRRIMVVRTRL